MAMTTGPGGGPMSDINVTPMVDVMLVLLVIFMVTAPLVQAGIKVDLPSAESPPLPVTDQKLQITVGFTVANDPSTPIAVWIGHDAVPIAQLGLRLSTNAIVMRDHEAYIQADRAIPYGTVVQVMGIMRGAGITKLGIVTDPVTSH